MLSDLERVATQDKGVRLCPVNHENNNDILIPALCSCTINLLIFHRTSHITEDLTQTLSLFSLIQLLSYSLVFCVNDLGRMLLLCHYSTWKNSDYANYRMNSYCRHLLFSVEELLLEGGKFGFRPKRH